MTHFNSSSFKDRTTDRRPLTPQKDSILAHFRYIWNCNLERISLDIHCVLAIILAMMSGSAFDVILDTAVYDHFRTFGLKDQRLILDVMDDQLSLEPMTQSRNCKPLRIPNTINATWELRCGANNRFRIFYDVDTTSRTVVVLAVGRKIRNALWIGNEEIEL